MRKLLLFWIMAVLVINTHAQGTSCSDPITAVVGDNSADNSSGSQWFVYTPTADKKITLSTCGLTTEDTKVYVYEDCSSSYLYVADDQCSSQTTLSFYGEANQTYYIQWANSYTTGSYTWSLSAEEIAEGDFCSLPMAATADSNNQHTFGEGNDQWYTYTATQDGKIVLENLSTTADSYVAIYTECGGAYVAYSYSEKLAFESTQDQTYYIKWYNYDSSDFYWSLSEDAIEGGEFCTNAVEATADSNNQHTFGEGADQWYTYKATQDGKIVIENLSESGSWYVQVYTNCDNYLTYSYDEKFAFESIADQTYYIRLKNYDSSDFYWSLSDEPLEGGEFCTNAVEATADSNNEHTLGEDMSQWYTYTATQDGKITLENLSTSPNSHVAVYTSCGSSILASTYSTKLLFESTEGQTYYIRWKNYNADSFTWSLSDEALVDGDFCSNAATAIEGSNEFTFGEDAYQWYVYTATQDGKMTLENLSSSASAYIDIYTDCDSYTKEGFNKVSFVCTSGETYYFKWINYDSDNFTWSLSEDELVDGDICSMALAAVVGENTADNSGGNQWFSYTPTTAGTLTVTTCDLTSEDTKVFIYNDCNSNYLSSNDDYCNYQSTLSYEVEANTTYYIMWDDAYTSLSYTWNLSFVSDITTGIAEVEQMGVSIYPNPATNHVTIEAENPVQYVRMLNMQGVVVKEVANPSNTIIIITT